MVEMLYPKPSKLLSQKRTTLAPQIDAAFRQFSKVVFQDGALPRRTKQLIAVAVAHVTQCPYCIRGHTKSAIREGATMEQVMEAVWVAAEMRAGGAFAHSALALDAIATEGRTTQPGPKGESQQSASLDQHTDAKLDEALKATFPASDPFQLSDPDRRDYTSPPCSLHEDGKV